ncbi:MAG: hypothetical protein ABUS54_04945 [Actinomycetota bacterium]
MIVVALAALALAAPNLGNVILKPTQVGTGYGVYARSDGFGVKSAPTLDLCGRAGYASEKLRVGRLQVNYLKANTALGLSNEVVTYKTGGAAQAMREVAQHATTCPKTPVKTGEAGLGPIRFTITPVHDSKLLKGYVAVRVHAVGKLTSGKKVDNISYAVYQRNGDVLSGVYSFGPDTPAQLQFVLHAAEQSAQILRHLKAVKPSGPPA